MKKGTRIWTCDGCGKQETWQKGWYYYPCVASLANLDPQGLLFPLAVCSEPCGDDALRKAMAQTP